MKQIGVRTHANEWSAPGKMVPGMPEFITDIYSTEPDILENVNSAMWEHIGWILPGDAANGGGTIYKEREGKNSVAAYVKRSTPPQPAIPQTVLRAEFDEMKMVIGALSERVERLERITGADQISKPEIKAKTDYIMFTPTDYGIEKPMTYAIEKPMTFYDHAFIAAYCRSQFMTVERAHEAAKILTAARHPS